MGRKIVKRCIPVRRQQAVIPVLYLVQVTDLKTYQPYTERNVYLALYQAIKNNLLLSLETTIELPDKNRVQHLIDIHSR